ncbi:NALCN channel auxiliary factor [Dirofilaria immitis]
MHAGKEKKRSSNAVGVITSTCANAVAENIVITGVKNISTTCTISSCNIDSPVDSNYYYWDYKKIIWPNEQSEIEWNQRYYCYHRQQQTINKLHNKGDSKVNNTIIEFDNCSQSGKYLLVTKNKRSLLISTSYGNNLSGREEEENCCFSKQRIVYQSYRDLKRTSTQQYNTASSSSSSSSLSSSSSSSSSLSSPQTSSLSPSLSSSFIRSKNHIRHHYRYQQQSRCILHANLKLFIYWHAFSLLACFAATGLSVRATVSKSLNSNDMKHTQDDVANIVLLEQSSKHLTSISTSTKSTNDSTSAYSNPFLRHFRSTSVRLGLTLDSFCYIWSSVTPNDLCELSPWARYQFLRKISIFNRDCLEENNIKAAQLFRLIPRYINNEADLRVQAKFLRADVEGQACILAPAGAQQCLSCFQKIDRGLKRVDKAYEEFNLTLHRFDCMLAVDTASATRPFSPNGSCTDCKIWYRKWLIMHSLNLWSVPPCINWCYYVQLACPHLATSKVVDYAGHPSFQCRDLHIPSVHRDSDLMKLTTSTSSTSKEKSVIASKCACLHPCDFEEFYNQVDTTRTAEQNRPNSYLSTVLKTNNEEEDFFPSVQHCMIRRHLCGSMNDEVEDHHVMRRSLTSGVEAVEEKLDNFRSSEILFWSCWICFPMVDETSSTTAFAV